MIALTASRVDTLLTEYSAWNRKFHVGPWRACLSPSVGAFARPCHFPENSVTPSSIVKELTALYEIAYDDGFYVGHACGGLHLDFQLCAAGGELVAYPLQTFGI